MTSKTTLAAYFYFLGVRKPKGNERLTATKLVCERALTLAESIDKYIFYKATKKMELQKRFD